MLQDISTDNNEKLLQKVNKKEGSAVKASGAGLAGDKVTAAANT